MERNILEILPERLILDRDRLPSDSKEQEQPLFMKWKLKKKRITITLLAQLFHYFMFHDIYETHTYIYSS